MTDNMKYWNQFNRPPATALKQIERGRLAGMSDINPQWRLQAMTETFGPIGIGWYYDIDNKWSEPTSDNQIAVFVEVYVYISYEDNGQKCWSKPIKGVGGSTLVAKESRGLHSNDEAYKMALTDALSVAMKQLGMAADIYAGLWDGSKYLDEPAKKSPKKEPEQGPKNDSGISQHCIVDDVELGKSGKRSDGSEWQVYIIHSNGEKYGTYNKQKADVAMGAAGGKTKVNISWKDGKYGKELVDIEPITNDDIPY